MTVFVIEYVEILSSCFNVSSRYVLLARWRKYGKLWGLSDTRYDKKIVATFISTHKLSVRFERKDDRSSISRTALYHPELSK